ncbi:MAG: glycosyltransferase family 39 protein [bacterium]|nr:glycosyltransferase family 39 protein [bacterium]
MDKIVAYGDAESHLNIAKRVVDGLTPGFAQLGGIWLPLPHVFLIPFVKIDFLWRSGLAGSIVSGTAYIISALFIYKIILLLFNNKTAAFMGAIVFVTNLNILYLQATPMTELTLIVFFVISTYYFLKFLNGSRIIDLIIAAFFGFCATLSRYDGWFFVGIEILILMLVYNPIKKIPKSFSELSKAWDIKKWHKMEGILILFTTLGFLGIVMWLGWDALILGDPFYFTHSEFSAKSQQQGWLAQGQLPTYHNLWLSFAYYFVTAMNGVGMLVYFISLVGFVIYLKNRENKNRFMVGLLLANTFLFYVLTLFMGQSVIFIPHITPLSFDWTLFNVRYGVMMVPFAAVFFGYLFSLSRLSGKFFMILLLMFQFGLYAIGYSSPLSYEDGVRGLSSSKRVDAEKWLKINYNGGLVLEDDFSRQLSIIRSGVPMQNVIYIGNKPYWEESLKEPEKYAKWIIVQQNDTIDKRIYQPPAMNGRLFKYFKLAYTSPEILIFERNDLPANSQ